MCQWTWIKSCHRAHYYDAQIINTLLLLLSQWWAYSIIHLVFYCSCRGVAISPTSGSIKMCYILGVHSTYTDMGWQYADRTCFAGDSTDTGLLCCISCWVDCESPIIYAVLERIYREQIWERKMVWKQSVKYNTGRYWVWEYWAQLHEQ